MPPLHHPRRRIGPPSPSLMIALLALFISLGGAGYAATTLTARTTSTLTGRTASTRSAPAMRKDSMTRGRRRPKGVRGARGVAGPPGSMGQPGIQGIQGIRGPTGDPGAAAVLQRTRLDFEGPHEQASVSSAYSQVETIGMVNKRQADTVLRVTVNDTIGVDGGGAGCAVQVRIDGVNDRGSSSGSEDTGTEAVVGTFSSAIFPATIVTEFQDLPPGPHTLTLWMRATYLNADTSVCLEGGGIYPVAVPHTALVDEMN